MSLRWIGILLLACAPAWAQSRITGTVTDSSGAVVPAVEVVIKNVETGQATPAQTNQSGVYSVSFLNPGRYELSCEQAGFKKFVRAGIVLETGTTSTIDVVLNVGQISDVINVTASAPLLESESGALGQLVENKMILNMPIESRRVGALVRLMGNVTFSGEDGGQSIPKFSVAGGRSYNQMWKLDGGVAQNQSNGSPQLSLNPPNESLQEFKVLANNYPAEYGRSGSGYIVMTTAGHQRVPRRGVRMAAQRQAERAHLLLRGQSAAALQHLRRFDRRAHPQEQDVLLLQLRRRAAAHRRDGHRRRCRTRPR